MPARPGEWGQNILCAWRGCVCVGSDRGKTFQLSKYPLPRIPQVDWMTFHSWLPPVLLSLATLPNQELHVSVLKPVWVLLCSALVCVPFQVLQLHVIHSSTDSAKSSAHSSCGIASVRVEAGHCSSSVAERALQNAYCSHCHGFAVCECSYLKHCALTSSSPGHNYW